MALQDGDVPMDVLLPVISPFHSTLNRSNEKDTLVAGNLAINMNAVARRVSIPDAEGSRLCFGQSLAGAGATGNHYDSLSSTGAQMSFDKSSNCFRQYIYDESSNGLCEVSTQYSDKVLLYTDQEIQSTKSLNIQQGASINFHNTDTSDQLFWELKSEGAGDAAKFIIKHTGAVASHVLEANDPLIDTVESDVRGRWPNVDGLDTSLEQQFSSSDNSPGKWKIGMTYYTNAETGMEISDDLVTVFGDVNVEGKLTVTEGTAAAFGDIATFQKTVTMAKSLYVKENLSVDLDTSLSSLNVSKQAVFDGEATAGQAAATVIIQHQHPSNDGVALKISKGTIVNEGRTVLKDKLSISVQGGSEKTLSGTEGLRIEQIGFTSEQSSDHAALEVISGDTKLQKTDISDLTVSDKTHLQGETIIEGQLEVAAESTFKKAIQIAAGSGADFNPYRNEEDLQSLIQGTLYVDANGFCKIAKPEMMVYYHQGGSQGGVPVQYAVLQGFQGAYYNTGDHLATNATDEGIYPNSGWSNSNADIIVNAHNQSVQIQFVAKLPENKSDISIKWQLENEPWPDNSFVVESDPVTISGSNWATYTATFAAQTNESAASMKVLVLQKFGLGVQCYIKEIQVVYPSA